MADPIRVAFVVHTFDMAGLERCIAHLANHLDRTRFQPVIICLNRSGSAEKWVERDDVPIFALGKRSGNDWRVIRKLAETLKEERVEVVHSHNWGTLVETTLACSRARIRAHLHAEHGLELSDLQLAKWRGRLRNWVKGWGLRRADLVVVVADIVRRRLIEHCRLPPDRIRFVPNGVERLPVDDPEAARRQIRQELGVSDDTVLIGSAGRLAPIKNFESAVAATAELRSQGRNVALLLVGDGPNRESILERGRELGITEHVFLPGRREDVGRWLAALDVFVNSSLGEAMSMSILEAMAAGLPMVVTDVGENSVLVGGDAPCGLVVPSGDVPALAGGLGRLSSDRALRLNFSKHACSRFEADYTVDQMVNAYSDLYESLCRSPAACNPSR